MAEFASKGVAGTGLGFGIAGTALGLLNGNGNGGILGGVLGGGSGDSAPINRYEAAQSARISELEGKLALHEATFYTVGELGKLRDYVDAKFEKVNEKLGEQMAYNAANNATIGCISAQVQQLLGLTKLVVPNSSVCPGWGNVTITPAAATTT